MHMDSVVQVYVQAPTMLLTPVPWPHLPPELQRDIFEIAARESTHTALVLVLVARHVHTW
jgi:hypothetical protein